MNIKKKNTLDYFLMQDKQKAWISSRLSETTKNLLEGKEKELRSFMELSDGKFLDLNGLFNSFELSIIKNHLDVNLGDIYQINSISHNQAKKILKKEPSWVVATILVSYQWQWATRYLLSLNIFKVIEVLFFIKKNKKQVKPFMIKKILVEFKKLIDAEDRIENNPAGVKA